MEEQYRDMQLRASETEVCLESIDPKTGEKEVYCRVPAKPGSDETNFCHVSANTVDGAKTGEVILVMIAGNWPELMKKVSASVVRDLSEENRPPAEGGVSQETVVTGITIEAHFAKAIERVCGDAVGEDWFKDPKHFAMALFQTPEIQQMLVPAPEGVEPVDKGRPDPMAEEVGKKKISAD